MIPKKLTQKKSFSGNSILLFTIASTSLVTFPFIFDSFTVSKLFVLAVGITFVVANLFFNRHSLKIPGVFTVYFFSSLFLLSITISWIASGVPFTRAMLGQFGRGNGLAYYYLVVILMLLCAVLFKESDEPKVHKMMISLGWILSIYAGFQRIGVDIAELDTRGLSPVVLTFGNSNFAGSMLAVLFAYHISHALLTKKFKIGQVALLLALLLGSTFAAAVQGYLIIVFSVAIALSALALRIYKNRVVRVGLALAWFTGGFFVGLGLLGQSALAGLFSRQTFQIRIEYWKIAFKVIQESPFFGVGPDKLYDYSAKFMAPGSIDLISATRLDSAHNWYLNIGANYGLLALVFYAIILFFVFLIAWRKVVNGTDSEVFQASSAIAFFAVFISGLVSIEQPGIGIWLYVFAGILISDQKVADNIHGRSLILQRPTKLTKVNLVNVLCVLTFLILTFISAILGNRVILDAQLRSSIQKIAVNEGTFDTVAKLRGKGEALKPEPEYAVKSLSILAQIGASDEIDAISKATYLYNTSSIQAILIRADVLRVLQRKSEACPLNLHLLENSPWDFAILKDYLVCTSYGFTDSKSLATLTISHGYFESFKSFEVSVVAKANSEVEANIMRASVLGRLNFEIGYFAEGRKFADYVKDNLATLEKLQIEDPNYRMGINMDEVIELIGY